MVQEQNKCFKTMILEFNWKLLLALLTALLKYNTYTIKFTYLMCTTKWFLVYSHNCGTIHNNFRRFSSPHKKPHTFSNIPLFSHSSLQFSSVPFSLSVVSDSLRPHESQHDRPPCPSPTPGVYSNSCPSSW